MTTLIYKKPLQYYIEVFQDMKHITDSYNKCSIYVFNQTSPISTFVREEKSEFLSVG